MGQALDMDLLEKGPCRYKKTGDLSKIAGLDEQGVSPFKPNQRIGDAGA